MNDKKTLPTGYPTASSQLPASMQVSGEEGATGATNTGATPGTGAHAGPRISSRRLREIQAHLSERDQAILASVDRYRFLTARHLQALHFTDHASATSASRTCRRALARLRTLRILGILDRRIGGIRAGSEGLVYYVDTAGDRLQRGVASSRARKRFDEPSARFLDHTLAIADMAIGIFETAAAHGAEVVKLNPEHTATRTYADNYGIAQVLRPDLYVELAAAAGDEDVSAFFIEVDLGHESLPTLLGKALTYEDYRSTGIEQHQYGGFPQVIWAMDAYRETTAQRRRKSLQDSLERNSRLNAGMYRIQSLQDAAAAVVQGLHHD